MRAIYALLLIALAWPALAQPTPGQVPILIVASCGTGTQTRGVLTITNDGKLCTTATVASGGTVTANQGTAAAASSAWPIYPAPLTASAAAITPIVSTTAESSHVICAAACNLYSASITTGAAAGFFMAANATSAQADGAITPIECVQVPANGSASINFGAGPPDRYSTGVTLLFSTTGCFNLTKSATAFFKGRGV